MRLLAYRIIALLMVQFFIGLAVNLWITLPRHHPGTNAADYFTGVGQGVSWALAKSGIVLLALHIIIALLLVVVTIAFMIVALVKKNRFWIVAHALGAFFIQAAFFNGASFLNYSEQFSSFLMEVFFVLSITVYIVALYKTKPS